MFAHRATSFAARFARRARRDAKRFVGDQSGVFAAIFGVALLVIVGFIGLATDYSQIAAARMRLQQATDAAALAAATSASSGTVAGRSQLAKDMVNSQFQISNATVTETEPKDANGAVQYVVDATASQRTYFMHALGIESVTIGAHSVAASSASGTPHEVALALDNTGSMKGVIGDLRTAATTLVDKLMVTPNVKISVVPYVAAVNPGLTDMNMVDTTAISPFHGIQMRGKWLAVASGCTPNWGYGGGGGGGGPVDPPLGGGNSGDQGGSAFDIIEKLNPFRRIARDVFGVAEAEAANYNTMGVTADTVTPLTLDNYSSPYSGWAFKVPAGFLSVWSGNCDWLSQPYKISYYDLHNKRILGKTGGWSSWKGCVEARLSSAEQTLAINNMGYGFPTIADFDINDLPPDANNAASLYVPYFWPDEPDLTVTWAKNYVAPGLYSSATQGYHNNFLPDSTLPAGWNWGGQDQMADADNILKYDGKPNAVIKESWPDTVGPNASCPDAVLRLTNNANTVKSKIANLGYWYNGGTVISEGVAWALRTLSPNAPYKDGAVYDPNKTQKVIVVMTDGVNGLADNGSTVTYSASDYSAYNYLKGYRLWQYNNVRSFDQLTDFLDGRTTAACNYAKSKGVVIYTVLYNHDGMSAAQVTRATNLLQNCASSASQFYSATDAATLTNAFAAIGAGISKVRLVK